MVTDTSATGGTVFALGGGGNLGAAQVGMLYALLEAGIYPDAIVGTSVGALNGAYLSGHGDLEGVEALAELWASVRRRDVFPISLRTIARGLLGRHSYLFESLALRSLVVRARLGFSELEDAPIPLSVVATDLATGDAWTLSTGPATDALVASAAIPGLFPPVEIDGRLLVDGGVVASVPIVEAASVEPSRIFVLPTVPDSLTPQKTTWDVTAPPSSAPAMVQRAAALAARPAARSSLSVVSARTEVHVLPAPAEAGRLSAFDFHATRELVDRGYELATAWIGNGRAHAHDETRAPVEKTDLAAASEIVA